MNRSRRQKLQEAVALGRRAMAIVQKVVDEEQNAIDNVPENLQYTDAWASMEGAIDFLTDAISDLESAEENIAKAVIE